MAAESSSSKPSFSKDSEYSLIDYSEYKKILEEDPLEIMEKLLSSELGHSSQVLNLNHKQKLLNLRVSQSRCCLMN